MFYGPPGTGKKFLYQAIASEYNLPIYYMHLIEMTDASLHDEFQRLPKRCMVVFEEIDTMGIERTSKIQTETKLVRLENSSDNQRDEDPKNDSENDSDDDPEHDEVMEQGEPKGHTQGGRKEKKKSGSKNDREEPKRSKITLGALLNILDGPGAQEGRS